MSYSATFSWAYSSALAVSNATPRDAPGLANDGSFDLLVWPTTGSTMAAGAKENGGIWTFLTGAAVDTSNTQLSIASTPAVLPFGGGRFFVIWADPTTQAIVYSTCTVSAAGTDGPYTAVWSPATPVFGSTNPPAPVVVDAPAVCSDGDTAYLAWLSAGNVMWFSSASLTGLTAAQLNAAGISLQWSTPVSLPQSFTGPSRPALAFFSSNLLLAFCGFSPDGGAATVYIATASTPNPSFTVPAALYDGNNTLMNSFSPPVLTGIPTGFLAVLRAGLEGQEMIPLESDGSSWNAYQNTGITSNFACGATNAGQSGEMMYWQGSLFESVLGTITDDPVTLTASVNPATWMTDLAKSGNFASLKLSQICMLGSHDAGMYTFLSAGEVSAILGYVVGGMCVAQSLTIGEQLSSGSRYFDLRPTTLLGEYMTYHGTIQALGVTVVAAYGAAIAAILHQVVDFIQNTPGAAEIIILKFSHPYALDASDLDSLSQSVWSALQGHLYTAPLAANTRLADLTYAELVGQTSTPATVVLPVFDLDTASTNAYAGLYKYADYNNSNAAQADLTVFDQYSNTTSIGTMIQDQRSKLLHWNHLCTDNVTPCDLFLLSWTLTPQSFGQFVSTYADIANSLFNAQYMPLVVLAAPNKPNILFLDFVQDANAIGACGPTAAT